jgi:hypothetical protein
MRSTSFEVLSLVQERRTLVAVKLTWRMAFAAASWVLLSACRAEPARVEPTIELTKIPPAGEGSPDQLVSIGGRVRDAKPGQRIVLFARSGMWWVQPTREQPFTEIKSDSTWESSSHPGDAYAALLVEPAYRPASVLRDRPDKGAGIVAVAIAEGAMLKRPARKTLHFSGYEWDIRQTASDRAGTINAFDPANAWTDRNGFLHLCITKKSSQWTSAEVSLHRGLGYGSYSFTVRDVLHLEPSAVFSIFTWDDSGPTRELDMEISRWGEPGSKNAQYVVQPYYVPANAVRFMTPAGTLTFSFRWEPGRVSFQTFRGSIARLGSKTVAGHVFTSGVPSPGNESIRINHYIFASERNPVRNGSEVIVERFQYLP